MLKKLTLRNRVSLIFITLFSQNSLSSSPKLYYFSQRMPENGLITTMTGMRLAKEIIAGTPVPVFNEDEKLEEDIITKTTVYDSADGERLVLFELENKSGKIKIAAKTFLTARYGKAINLEQDIEEGFVVDASDGVAILSRRRGGGRRKSGGSTKPDHSSSDDSSSNRPEPSSTSSSSSNNSSSSSSGRSSGRSRGSRSSSRCSEPSSSDKQTNSEPTKSPEPAIEKNNSSPEPKVERSEDSTFKPNSAIDNFVKDYIESHPEVEKHSNPVLDIAKQCTEEQTERSSRSSQIEVSESPIEDNYSSTFENTSSSNYLEDKNSDYDLTTTPYEIIIEHIFESSEYLERDKSETSIPASISEEKDFSSSSCNETSDAERESRKDHREWLSANKDEYDSVQAVNTKKNTAADKSNINFLESEKTTKLDILELDEIEDDQTMSKKVSICKAAGVAATVLYAGRVSASIALDPGVQGSFIAACAAPNPISMLICGTAIANVIFKTMRQDSALVKSAAISAAAIVAPSCKKAKEYGILATDLLQDFTDNRIIKTGSNIKDMVELYEFGKNKTAWADKTADDVSSELKILEEKLMKKIEDSMVTDHLFTQSLKNAVQKVELISTINATEVQKTELINEAFADFNNHLLPKLEGYLSSINDELEKIHSDLNLGVEKLSAGQTEILSKTEKIEADIAKLGDLIEIEKKLAIYENENSRITCKCKKYKGLAKEQAETIKEKDEVITKKDKIIEEKDKVIEIERAEKEKERDEKEKERAEKEKERAEKEKERAEKEKLQNYLKSLGIDPDKI